MAVQHSQWNVGCLVAQEKMLAKILCIVAQVPKLLTERDIPDTRVNKSNVGWMGIHDDVMQLQLVHNTFKKILRAARRVGCIPLGVNACIHVANFGQQHGLSPIFWRKHCLNITCDLRSFFFYLSASFYLSPHRSTPQDCRRQ